MSTQIINTKKGIQIGVAVTESQDGIPVSMWMGHPITELSNEELTLLWFKLDRHLDVLCLEEIYIEMNIRGIARIIPY